LAQRCGAKVTAVTVQFEDYNPLTVQGAVKAAQEMEVTQHIINVKAVEFLYAIELLAGMTEEPLLDLDLALVYAALKKYDHRIAGDVFIAGMGSDQWFGNEALDPNPKDLQTRLDSALADEAVHQKVAQTHGCKFIFPFLSQSMLALSLSIPASMKKDKSLLRALAIANKIPHRGAKSEIQVPDLMRRIVVKAYGDRAWPCAVSADGDSSSVDDQILRQIIFGLWLEKTKKK
jgi:asparagine synthetase B (glutamine-hydrolysing)